MSIEKERLREEERREKNWKRWGPYLSERQWGTVREDYSANGDSWNALTHDDARRRAYRWGEDGLNGWCDRQCRLCFAPALWNGKDPILKERLYGLAGPEGNHGEDVKECYYYLDSTPTHSYTKALYKYPQCEFPYVEVRDGNQALGRDVGELELADLGVFEGGEYFDVVQEVAKRSPEDLLWRITVRNHGPNAATIHVLPQLWFRNTWRWGNKREHPGRMPEIVKEGERLVARHDSLGEFLFFAETGGGEQPKEWLFTENETNYPKLFRTKGPTKYTKEAFHRYVVEERRLAVSPEGQGTKATPVFELEVPAGGSREVVCRLHSVKEENGVQGLDGWRSLFEEREGEADEFYEEIEPRGLNQEERLIFRQGHAGLLWTKQFFYYVVKDWLEGDRFGPPPPEVRKKGRNSDWEHFFARDILSMPDKWEYPWFAAWDTAFHMIPFAITDPEFAKSQLLLLLREWYTHPNGQLPAYEWNFSDANPPVHAWAVWRVYKIAGKKGQRDLDFLERCFQKLLINFTWWVNRKDVEGRHVFGGGFLGLDNIGVFDRSHALPDGAILHQADGTAWMGAYCLQMMAMALELAESRPPYEDIASKFLEHFVEIMEAINSLGGTGLWDDEDGFYYDKLMLEGETPMPMKIRSLVGLLPLVATMVIKQETLNRLPGFRKRMDWFLLNNPEVMKYIQFANMDGEGRCMLAIPTKERLEKTLVRLFDEGEFLSDFGIRSLSKAHATQPFVFEHGGERNEVRYVPGESDTGMFGGNSNWRGPIWFPTNFLIVESLLRYHYFFGDEYLVEYPTGSGNSLTLRQIARDLSERLIGLFKSDEEGYRPCFGEAKRYADEEDWRDLLLFHEYFHGETGEGLGASHQTGWTALVVRLLRDCKEKLGDC
ncbi:MAG: glucosidase [Verrucomicrobiota bacterium]